MTYLKELNDFIRSTAVPAHLSALLSSEHSELLIMIPAVLLILSVGSMAIIFRRAGKIGWTALIPFWNIISLYRLFGRVRWLFEILITALAGIGLGIYIFDPDAGAVPEYMQLVPAALALVSAVIAVITGLLLCRGIARGMNRGKGFGLGLMLLWPVFVCVLALSSKTRYIGNIYTGKVSEDSDHSSVLITDEVDDYFTEDEMSDSGFHNFEGPSLLSYPEIAETEEEEPYTDAPKTYSGPAETDAGNSAFLSMTYEAEENEEYKAEIEEAVELGIRRDGFISACYRKDEADSFSGYVYEIAYRKGTETMRFITDVLAFDPTKLAKYHLYCDAYEYNDLAYAVNFRDQQTVSGEVPLGTNFSIEEAIPT